MLDILEYYKDISELSNFKTKAKAKYYFEINDILDFDELKNVFEWIRKYNIKFLIIGGGTNILFGFDLYDGIIIKNNLDGWKYNKNSNILETFSNDNISDIAYVLENKYNQDLWHRFIGLPGSIGGAIYGNAGCFGLETSNNFLECKVLNIDNLEEEVLTKEQMNFDYRTSILKETGKYFIYSAKFDLSKKIEKYHSDIDNLHFREHKQPKGNTCGSFFKNPTREISAGKLIEEVGLKGHKIGGAYFSNLHANFLMNDGNATYNDLLSIINLAKDKVNKSFKIELLPEVKIITN